MPAWLVRGGLLLGLAGGLWFLVSHLESAAFKRGELSERAKWQEEQAEVTAATRQKYDEATGAAAQRDTERERAFAPIEKEVIRYVQTPAAAAECIDNVGHDLMQRAIEAANASLTAPTGEGGPAVPAAAGRASDGG